MKEEDNHLDMNNNSQEENSNSNSHNNFHENEQTSFNETNENVANVVNSPIPIVTSSEQFSNEEGINEDNSKNYSKLKIIFNPITTLFLKLGNSIYKLTEKIHVQPSYKYFLIFLGLGLLLLLFSLLYIPLFIFEPGKLLRLLSFGNIFIMFSFLFYYGSNDFFAFLIDPKRTCVMFTHIFVLFCSLLDSLFIGGYFLELFLDIILCITTVIFILSLTPGGQEGIVSIHRLIISPFLLLINNFKGKMFGDSNNEDGT